MEYRLYLGDCLDILRQCPDNYVDLVVTSPPYDNLRIYNGYTFQFEAIADQLARVLKPGGVIVWVVNDATINGSETGSSFRQALYFKGIGLNLHDTMIYQKLNAAPITAPRYHSVFEYMFVFSKGKVATFNPITEPCIKAGKSRSGNRQWQRSASKGDYLAPTTGAYGKYNEFKTKANVWGYLVGNISVDSKWRHPAKFPLQLALDHIQSWSNPGDIVLDPFLGSGTTGVAALQLGRKFRGIEISEEYFELAKRRIEESSLSDKEATTSEVS